MLVNDDQFAFRLGHTSFGEGVRVRGWQSHFTTVSPSIEIQFTGKRYLCIYIIIETDSTGSKSTVFCMITEQLTMHEL